MARSDITKGENPSWASASHRPTDLNPFVPPRILDLNPRLDSEGAFPAKPSFGLLLVAKLTAFYPLVPLFMLYGQWLLSWWVLGHCPRPSQDDPKDIDWAGFLHLFTALALVGTKPCALAAVIANLVYLVEGGYRNWRWCLLLMFAIPLWVAMYCLLKWDPGKVLYWWLD